MRVEGVYNFTNIRAKRNYNDYAAYSCITVRQSGMHDLFIKTSPSFTAITTHGQFRYLTHNHIIRCPYCRKGMIYTGDISEMQRTGIFSGDVKTFVERMTPYKRRLKPINRLILNKIEKYSRKAPHTTLSTIIENLYENSEKKLRKLQKKILKQLSEEAKNLPKEVKPKFEEFMRTQCYRLDGEPYPEKFHGKSFKYKVNKIAQSFSNNEDLKNYLLRIVSRFEDPIFKDDNQILPDEIAITISRRFAGKKITAKEAKLHVINRIQRIGERFDRKDVVELCKSSEKMIEGKPVKINFSNKEFMHDLIEDVLTGLKGKEVYVNMVKIAQQLPTSKKNFNSFIVKWRYSSSDIIATKLLDPSSATIEHVKPTSEGGQDIPLNWVLACKEDNNRRMSTKLNLFLRRFSPRNPQAYFNDIIEITNNERIFTENEVKSMAENFDTQGHTKIKLTRLKTQS